MFIKQLPKKKKNWDCVVHVTSTAFMKNVDIFIDIDDTDWYRIDT